MANRIDASKGYKQWSPVAIHQLTTIHTMDHHCALWSLCSTHPRVLPLELDNICTGFVVVCMCSLAVNVMGTHQFES